MYTIKQIVNKGSQRLKNTSVNLTEKLFYSKKASNTNTDIIILRLDGIGDYVLFRNFIEEVHNTTKGKLVLCGNIIWKELAEKLDGKFISEFIWVDVPMLGNDKYRYSIYKKLQQTGCNILLHPVYSRTADADKLAIHSGAKEIIGYNGDTVNISQENKTRNNYKYTDLLQPSEKYLFEFYRNKYFFDNILDKKLEIKKPAIQHSEKPESEKNKYIIIFPGAGHEKRRWPAEYFAKLCKVVNEVYKLPVLICGSKSDTEIASKIIASGSVNIQDCTGKVNLYETSELIQRAALIIANDSGPMHISVALSIPTICISNGNNYGRFCPYPKEMAMSLSVVLPDEFENMINDNNTADKLFGEESDINMNLIKPGKVFQTVKQILR